MPGQLFTNYFLEEGILHTDAWQESLSQPPDFDSFRAQAHALLENAANFHTINEASTEQELIRPLFELLGWVDYLPQQGSDHNEDIPDHLLFGDAESKDRAAAKPAPNRYPDALAVAESKRFNRLSTHAARPVHRTARSSAILPPPTSTRTGASAGASSPTAASGVSTTAAPSPAPAVTTKWTWKPLSMRTTAPMACAPFACSLVDPPSAPNMAPRPASLKTPSPKAAATKNRSQTIFPALVFDEVYPALIRALAQKSGAELEHVRQAALIFLYRLLFLLYAEDRDLLPVNDSRYDDYGLRKSVRDDIDKRIAAGDTFSTIASNYFNHIATLCRQIDEGDASIGLPPYNGGLFAPASRAHARTGKPLRRRAGPDHPQP